MMVTSISTLVRQDASAGCLGDATVDRVKGKFVSTIIDKTWRLKEEIKRGKFIA
jgi:hypothetical protein